MISQELWSINGSRKLVPPRDKGTEFLYLSVRGHWATPRQGLGLLNFQVSPGMAASIAEPIFPRQPLLCVLVAVLLTVGEWVHQLLQRIWVWHQ